MRKLMVVMTAALMAFAGTGPTAAFSQQAVASRPNNTPLMFGMSAEQASQALGVPLQYVRGRPGDELFLATSNVKGSALSRRSDGLYLQFRKRRLAGWKGDWGTIRP
jgi:hypothetical protein